MNERKYPETLGKAVIKVENENPLQMIIDQSKLTSECWSIQITGLSACNDCEYINTPECGGKQLRKQYLKDSQQ